MPRPLRAILLPLALAACKGLTPLNPDAEGGDTDAPGDPDAPVLTPLAPYQNEDTVVVTGTAKQSKVRLTWSGPEGEDSREVPVAGGEFEYTVGIGRGAPTTFTAVGIDGSDETGASEPVATEACDPPDSYEIEAYYGKGYGDTCDDDPVYANGALPDDGSVQTFVGNLHSADDVDWIRVTASDPGGDETRGYENFKLAARFVQGEGTFQMTVYRGGCTDSETECPGDAYDEYSWFMDDQEPDESGSTPADPRACGLAPYNECMDLSGDFYILVSRSDGGFDCTPYEVEVTNGVW